MRRLIGVLVLLQLGGCASLPVSYERVVSYALPATSASALGQAGSDALKAHAGESGFRPLPNGVDALVARMALAEAAEHSLDVQYYIWRGDLTGQLFANALLRAADRGVRVRILLDDVGTRANDDLLLDLDAHPNIEIRLFNPVASRMFRGLGMLSDFSRVNRRMHNKAFVADNQRAVLGGRNIADAYFEAHGDVAFGDLDVLTLGPVVADVSAAFDDYWNAPMSIPIGALTGRANQPAGLDTLRANLAAFARTQRDSPYVRNAQSRMSLALSTGTDGVFWGRAVLLVDDPYKVGRARDDTEGHLLPQLGTIARQTRGELLILSAYFIPGDAGVAWLRGMAEKGVKVTVLTNSLASTDVDVVHAAYQRYREALLEAGVRLYELKPETIEHARGNGKKSPISGSRASLHAKTFVFDRRAVFIGSLNLDPRSTQLNTEIGVVCESPALAGALAGAIDGAIDQLAWRLERVAGPDGKARLVWIDTTAAGIVKHDQEPEVSAWRKLSVWLLGLLPIESQL